MDAWTLLFVAYYSIHVASIVSVTGSFETEAQCWHAAQVLAKPAHTIVVADCVRSRKGR